VEEFYCDDTVEVLDREFNVLYSDRLEETVRWICRNAVGPSMVWIVEAQELVSIDEFLREWDDVFG